MSSMLKLSFPAALSLLALAGVSPPAAAQPAVLYEIVENIDPQKTTLTRRVSNWTAQGTAEANSAFCPAPTPCTITAFGTDDIDLTTLSGRVWANITALANPDNPVDGPEYPFFSGQLTGDISFFTSEGTIVTANLSKNKSILGPIVPLIYVRNGKFWADSVATVRTAPQVDALGNYVVPADPPSATFTSTFRLPFNVGKSGGREGPERGRNAYYLADDGSLIKVDKQDEFTMGFPLLRAEVVF